MSIQLLENTYGESHVRLLRVSRQEGRHDIRELSLGVRFEGGFEDAHVQGDNRKILPADTMKNTIYALARQHSIEPLENFGLHLIPLSRWRILACISLSISLPITRRSLE